MFVFLSTYLFPSALLDDNVYPHVYYTFPVKTERLREDLLLLVLTLQHFIQLFI